MNIIFALLFFSTCLCQAYISYSHKYPDPCLIHALKNNNIHEVRILLQAGISLNCADDTYTTPLMYAALTGNDRLVRLLLQYGAHVDYVNQKKHTVLFDIVYIHTLYDSPLTSFNNYQENYVPIIMILILYGADFRHFTAHIHTALEDILPAIHMAVLQQKERKVQKLLVASTAQTSWLKKIIGRVFSSKNTHHSHTLDPSAHATLINPEIVNQQDSLYALTPLHIAAACGLHDMVNVLINAGASLNPHDNFGNTPLHYAALNDHVEVVELLLNAGVDTISSNNDGQTALQFAQSILQQRNQQITPALQLLIQALRSYTI